MATRRDFLKNAGALIYGATLVGDFGGCISSFPLVEQQTFNPVNIEIIPFEKYSPKRENEKIELDDMLLMDYIEKPIMMNELDNYVRLGKYNKIEPIVINDKGNFKREITRTASELGYNNLEALSIQEAIFASGKIVAHKMEYSKEMIGEAEKLLFEGNPQEIFFKLLWLSVNSKDIRNKEARRIDELPVDALFSEGNGVCRNYARVNAAVFNVMKEINHNLINTYMREYSPESIGHTIVLPHGWNVVFTLNNNGEEVDILTSYVDPTWLDTRKKTKDNSGEISRESEIQLYNALDESHFGPNLLIANSNFAGIYENLGSETRFYYDKISKEGHIFYKNKGFEQRITNMHYILDNVNNESNYTIINFQNNFESAVEDLTHSITAVILKFGINLKESLAFEPYDKILEKFKRLESVYYKAKEKMPKCIFSRNIEYYITVREIEEENGFKKTDIANRFTSVDELFNKVKMAFEN